MHVFAVNALKYFAVACLAVFVFALYKFLKRAIREELSPKSDFATLREIVDESRHFRADAVDQVEVSENEGTLLHDDAHDKPVPPSVIARRALTNWIGDVVERVRSRRGEL